MVIFLPILDFSILEIPEDGDSFVISYYFVSEEKVKDLIRNNRTRTVVSKREVLNFFNLKDKVQIVKAKRITVKPYDKIIFPYFGKYFVMEFVLVKPFCNMVLGNFDADLTNKK